MIKYDAEIRRLAKRANQRMVEMESRGKKSPAYNAVQSALEMMGRRSGKAAGRRFSETGKGTENELRQMRSELEKFLNQKTSTVRGYKEYRKTVYEGADKEYKLKEAGITQEQFEELWNELPDKEQDRMYYAAYYIQIMETYEMKVKSGEIKKENALTITDMIRILEGSTSLKDALTQLGISAQDIREKHNILYGG